MLLFWELAELFDFWPLRPNLNCPLFSFSLIWVFHMPHVSILLPVNHAQPFQQIAAKWGERLVTLQSSSSSCLGYWCGTAPNSKSFRDPIMCLALRPRPNHSIFTPSQIPHMPLLFPLAWGHRDHLSVLLFARHPPPSSPLLQSSFHFPKTNLGPGPSDTVRLLMGESLNVHAWEAFEPVLCVVNNKQNHYIPAANKQVNPAGF